MDSPQMLNSLAELGRALDQSVPVARPAPNVRVVQLPDVPAARKRKPKRPWPVAAPAEAADSLVLHAPPRRRRSAIDWKLVGSIGTAATVVLGVLAFAAYVTSPRDPKPIAQPAPVPIVSGVIVDPLAAEPVVAVAPVIQEPAAEERVALLEKRHRDEVARLEAEKPVVAPKEEPAPAAPAPKEEPVAVAKAEPVAEAKGGKINYGTAVDFVASPTEAAEQALKQKKLVLILTISGNFEESCFT